MSESALNTYERTLVYGFTPQDSDGNFRIVTSSAQGAITYDNFADCVEFIRHLAVDESSGVQAVDYA